MTFEVMVLGCGSARPVYPSRNMTAQTVNHSHMLFLVDCGEGTQLQMQKYGVKMSRIERVFISHSHGDHILGLPGLISTMSMNGRKEPLVIHGPTGLDSWLTEYFRLSRFFPDFGLIFKETPQSDTPQILYENPQLEVLSLPLSHSLPTCGFLFREKPKKRKVIASKLPQTLPFELFELLKSGQDIHYQGITYINESVTLPAPPPRSYAYCSDTAYHEPLISWIRGVDLLYHEATFLNKHTDKAIEKAHSTTGQAAQIARRAEVKKLLIGHYSSRYKTLDGFEQECREIFQNTELAQEGIAYSVGN